MIAGTLSADGYGQLDGRRRWQRRGERKDASRRGQSGSSRGLLSSRCASVDEGLREGQEGERRDEDKCVLDTDREAQVQHTRADHVEEAVRRFLAVADLGGSAVEGLEHEVQATAGMFDGEFWIANLASRDLVKKVPK